MGQNHNLMTVNKSLKKCSKVQIQVSSPNGNEIKYYIYSTVKSIGETDTFSNTGPQKVSYMLCRPQYGHT